MVLHDEPTLNLSENSAEFIAQQLRMLGYVLLRGAIDPVEARKAGQAIAKNSRRLMEVVGKEVNDMPLCFADDEGFDPISDSGITKSWYYEGARNYKLWYWQNGEKFPNRVLELVRGSILPEIFNAYFKQRCTVAYEYCTVRYQDIRIEKLHYPFHQDGNYQSRNLQDRTGLTTWIPFVECGIKAPGLEIVKNKFHEILPSPKDSREPVLASDPELITSKYSNKLWHPEFHLGDVMIFDNLTVHRTYFCTGMSMERQSSDFRVFPSDDLPGYVASSSGWRFEL